MFRPYHTFANCGQLENKIAQLREAGLIGGQVLNGYNIYHHALVHKLKCALHHTERLADKLLNSSPSDVLATSSDFVFAVNMSIDGFFYAGGSALDILAREILTYYGETLPALVYFKTARERLSISKPGDDILIKLDDPSWKEEFTNYRNSSTHELILATNYSIHVTSTGDTSRQEIVLPLPDDPRVAPTSRTYTNNPNVLIYTRDHLRRLLSLINQIYGRILNRIDTVGRLPL